MNPNIEIPLNFRPMDGCECDTCVEYRVRQVERSQAQLRRTFSTAPTATLGGLPLITSYAWAVTSDPWGALGLTPEGIAQEPAIEVDPHADEELAATQEMIEAATDAAHEAAATRRRIAQYKRRGIGVIPDDECTDKGDYVIWNKFDPTCTLLLKDPAYIVDQYETLQTLRNDWGDQVQERKNKRLMAHPTKPVRLTGMYYYPHTRYCVRFVAGATQGVILISGNDSYVGYDRLAGYFSPSQYGEDPRLATPRDIPVLARFNYMERLAQVIDGRPGMGYVMANHRRLMNPLSSPADSNYMQFRGARLYRNAFIANRDALKEIGQVIAGAECNDWDTLVGLIEGLNDSVKNRCQSNIIAAWNNMDDCPEQLVLADCGHVCPEDSVEHVHGNEAVCPSCFEDDYVEAADTGNYHHRDNLYLHSDDEYRTYPEDDDSDEDSDDEDEDSVGGRVRGYSTNVLNTLEMDTSIQVSSYGEFLMGIELEVEPKRRCRVDTVMHTMSNLCQQYAILKNDGSLNNGGFEIVTAPRGLKEHLKRFTAWKPHEDLTAWDAGSCGMHVHISSGAFSQATLGKFIEFINASENADMIESIAGRHARSSSQCQSYCQQEGRVVKGNPKMTLDGKSTSRYYMVNTANLTTREANRLGLSDDHAHGQSINTIELRIFRATLKKSRLLAQIEFAHAAVMFCRWSSMRELRKEHFINWLRKSAGSYPHLAKWFGVRANTQAIVEAPQVREEAEV